MSLVNRQSYSLKIDNPIMSTFGERLREARKDKKLSQTALAKLVGLKQPTIAEAETEGKGSSRAALLAKVLGVNALWLSEGKGDKGTVASPEIDLSDNEDYPPVRRVTLTLSAGHTGYAIEHDIQDKTPIVFAKEWFISNGYKPENLLAVKVKGESMQPSLHDGDTVTLNIADTKPMDGFVFAINYEGELLIKRLIRDAGTWWISSDNPDQRKYPRKECINEGCLILGRIVHKQSEFI
jgi:phage repressor protein C with HTH and peptisase S24 domain